MQHVPRRAADGTLSSEVQLRKETLDGAWVLRETPASLAPSSAVAP